MCFSHLGEKFDGYHCVGLFLDHVSIPLVQHLAVFVTVALQCNRNKVLLYLEHFSFAHDCFDYLRSFLLLLEVLNYFFYYWNFEGNVIESIDC